MKQKNISLTHLPDELSEFVSVDYPPQDDKPVLVIREAIAGANCKYEVVTGFYKAELRSWRTPEGYWLHGRLLGWKQAIRWLQAR